MSSDQIDLRIDTAQPDSTQLSLDVVGVFAVLVVSLSLGDLRMDTT